MKSDSVAQVCTAGKFALHGLCSVLLFPLMLVADVSWN